MVLVDVLRRTSQWQLASELATQLRNEQSDRDRATVISFQEQLVKANDHRAHTISEAFEQPPEFPHEANNEVSKHLLAVLMKLTAHRYNEDGSYKDEER
jgi:hypothetical protein